MYQEGRGGEVGEGRGGEGVPVEGSATTYGKLPALPVRQSLPDETLLARAGTLLSPPQI